MNKRIKKKKEKQKNKYLCERYPFLIPRNWEDKIIWSKEFKKDWHYSTPYSYTKLIDFPQGWFKAFGKEMLEELREECIRVNYLNELRIMQIKEKYGGLRFYIAEAPVDSKIFDIIDKYEELSFHYCMICGRPAETIDNCGWLMTICNGCQAVMNNRIKQYNEKRKRKKNV